ncbi:MAG: hypothetical protein AB7U35_12280 [Sphingobium sp.]
MRKSILLAAAYLALVTPSVAQAQDKADISQEEAAISALNKQLEEHWSANARGQFIYLGYYTAASAMCDGLELDREKLSKAVNEDILVDTEGMSEDDKKKRRDAFLMHLGLATGVFMGMHSHDSTDFCARAISERDSSRDSSSLFK